MQMRIFAILLLVLATALPGARAQSSGSGKDIQFLKVEQAASAPIDSYVFLRGKIISILPPRPESNQPYSLYVADATGKLRIVIFQPTWDKITNKDFLVPGSSVDIYGQAGEFKNVRQLAVNEPNHIRLTPDTPVGGYYGYDPAQANAFFPVTIGALNLTLVGQRVRVRGNVREILPPPRETYPTRVYVVDKTGEIEVVYWSQVTDKIPPREQPRVGEPIEFRGIVNEYRGKLQLRVDEPDWVSRNFEEQESPTESNESGNSSGLTPPGM